VLQQALYSLLALLPQSLAFKTLHTRLSSTPPLAMLSIQQQAAAAGGGQGAGGNGSGKGGGSGAWADFEQLLQVGCLAPGAWRTTGLPCQ
jgi:hypothetical protein